MSFCQKQYSSYHFLPNKPDEFLTILPRTLLKTDFFIDNFDIRNEIPLICYLTNLLLNSKNDKHFSGQTVVLKYSTLRNFLRKKCHSEQKEYLDELIFKFFNKLKNDSDLAIFNIYRLDSERIEISFIDSYLKKLEKNTVSFNLYDLTKLRGQRAKKIFIKIISYDMRDIKERFFTLKSISTYLGLDCFKNRKTTIRSIKKAFKSLSLKNLVTSIGYIGLNKENLNQNYRFIYKLGLLRQQSI